MATIERDFGLKADEQGFLLGVKKLGQDVAQIDTNAQRILDILGHAPVQDFKQLLQQSTLSTDTAKIAANSTDLLESNKQIVTLLSSRTQGQGSSGNTQPPRVNLDHPNRSSQNAGQGSGDVPPTPRVDINHPNRPPQGASDTPSQTDIQPPSAQPPQNDDNENNTGERQRDDKGRFVGSGDSEKKGFFGKIVQAIKSGFSGDSTNIDPSIEAMREVGQVLAPVGKVAEFTLRPFGFRNKEKNKPLSREEERHNRRQIKLLERIARMASRGGSSSGGNGGLLGGLLSRGGGLLKGAGGLLLRAVLSPVALLAGAFFGGYKLGEIIAPKISEWTDSLIKADIPKRISNAWDTFTGGLSDYFKEKWHNVTENAKQVANDAKDKVGSVGDFAAYQTDKLLATVGATKAIREAAQERLNQRDRGEIGFTPQNYQAQTSNKHTLGQVMTDTGEALTTQPLAENTSNIKKIIVNNADGSNTVQLEDGSIVKRTGSRNWRNNNSGNIEYGGFAKKHGAIGSDGRFAIFPSYEAGRAAKSDLIFNGGNYKDLDLMGAIHRYAPPKNKFGQFENDTAKYQRTVLASVGGANKRMADYTPNERNLIMDAMEKMEGYKKGKEQLLQPKTAKTGSATPTANTTPTTNSMPMVTGLATTPLAILSKVQAPAFSLMRPTQQITTNPSAISQTQHKIAMAQIPKPENIKEPMGTPNPIMVRNVDNGQQITQNLGDRNLAHLVTGGLGMDRWIK